MPHSHALTRDREASITGGAPPVRTPRWLLATLIVLAIAVIVALGLTWPSATTLSSAQGATFVHGTVTATAKTPCGSNLQCTVTSIRLDDGPDRGTTTSLTFPPGPASDPGLAVSEQVRLQRADTGGRIVYDFDDVERGTPLLILAIVFAVLVVLIARWRGLAALIGLVVSFVLLAQYLLPALLDGHSPVWTAVIAGGAIVFVVVPLAHGRGAKSAVAIAGTLLGVLLCAALSSAAVAVSHLTGFASEEVPTLLALGSPTTVGGLVLAGAVIGSIGVLNDVTITQASAVLEIATASPGTSRRGLFLAGMRVGRDHIASTVYTLALAYAGSALPILLLLATSGRSGTDAFTSDAVAGEIIRSLAGGIGLVLAVPVTTGLAALAATRSRSTPGPRSVGPG